MENWLIQLAEFVRGTLKGVFPALENALRGLLTFLYPAYADSFDIPGLATELTVLLLAAAFAVLVKLICLLFARKSRTPFVLGVLAVFLLFLIPSVTVTKTMIRSEKDYRAAENLLNRGRYAEAIGTFRELGEYRGAGTRGGSSRSSAATGTRRRAWPRSTGNCRTGRTGMRPSGCFRTDSIRKRSRPSET